MVRGNPVKWIIIYEGQTMFFIDCCFLLKTSFSFDTQVKYLQRFPGPPCLLKNMWFWKELVRTQCFDRDALILLEEQFGQSVKFLPAYPKTIFFFRVSAVSHTPIMAKQSLAYWRAVKLMNAWKSFFRISLCNLLLCPLLWEWAFTAVLKPFKTFHIRSTVEFDAARSSPVGCSWFEKIANAL